MRESEPADRRGLLINDGTAQRVLFVCAERIRHQLTGSVVVDGRIAALQRAYGVPESACDVVASELRDAGVDEDRGQTGLELRVLRRDQNILFLDARVPVEDHAEEDAQDRNCEARDAQKPVGARALLALPQGIERTAEEGGVETHHFLVQSLFVDRMIWTGNVRGERFIVG